MGSLTGKTALVTGAGRGIGRAIAKTLAAEGALVCATYRTSRGGAESLVAEIEALGGQAFALPVDVSLPAEIAGFYEAWDAELATRRGEPALDILVNNAADDGPGTFAALTPEKFDEIFATNAKGVYFMCQYALPRLRDGGRIINISSLVARTANPGRAAYSASKAAVNSLTRSLALELGPRGISVNSLLLGATATEMIAHVLADPDRKRRMERQAAMGRLGQPEDVAGAVLALAADHAGWITGQMVEVTGGVAL